MIKPNATDASKNRLANVGTGKVARTEDYLANIGDLPTYYYEKYKNANNKFFDSNMWSIAAQRGELDVLTSAINRNTEDLNNNLYNETFDNLQQNFAGMYDYDTYMLALEYPYLNNTIKKTRSDAETGTVFGDYTDKEWADYIFENATERFAAMQLEEKKANANGFLKAINSILASFWEVGAGVTEFFSDLYNIFQGLSVEEYIRNGIRTGEWNYINHFREAFVDEDGIQIISTGLSNAIYEFERQNTDMVNAVEAADAGYALGEDSNWIKQVYKATNAGSSYTTIGKFLAFGGEAIGYMLPTIGLGIATGGASTAAGSGTNIFGKIAAFFKPNLSNGLFYAGILSGNYKENLNTYLSKGGTLEEFNGFEGMTNAFLKTSFEYVIEKALSLALGATLLDRLIGTAVGKTGAKTAEKIITNASKKGASAFGKAATRLTKDAAKEGLEELLQDLSNDMWDLAYNGFYKERGLDNLTFQNLVDAFLIGAMVSGTISSIRNLKYVPSKNRGTIVTDKGEIVSMGYFQTLNYNEAMRVISEWYSTTQDANASKEEKENAAMKLAIAIDTLGSVFNAIGDNRTLIANKVLVETYKQKEEVDKYTKLPDAEYAAKLVDEWYKNQSKLFIDYLNKKLSEKATKKKEREENQPTIVKKLRNLFTKNAKELKNAGVTKIETAITESKSINEGISNVSPELAQAFSDAAKMVNKDNKLGVIVVSGKNRRLAIRSEDIVVLSKEELNALATDKSAFAASIALKSAVTTLKAKIKEAGALKLIVNEYIRVSGTKVEKAKDKDALIDDAVVLLMTSPKFYTTMLLRCGEISGDGKVNRLALLKVLTTMNQIIDGKLAVALNKGSVAKDIYDNIMKKARDNMRAGLIIYATQYINLDTGNISNDVLDSNTKSYLSNNLKYEKNVRFTESINEIKKESDIGALNEKYIAQYKRDLERCIQNLAMFYPEYIPVFNSISEDCINQISSEKARDREEAIAVLIFLSDTFVRNSEISKSTFAKEKVTYLPMNIDAGSYLFNREIIRNVEMFFGPNYTIDRLISGKMTVDNDSTKLTEEAKNFIKVNGYDITNRESMINCVSTVLSNMSGGALLLGADGTVLCSLTADEFLKAEYAKNPLLIYDRVKSGEVTLVGELKIPDLIIPEKLSNCGLKIYDFGADSNTVAAYDIENDIIYINSNKSKFSVVPFLHELTHATQKMTGDIVKDPITGDKNVLMQTGANKIYFKNFDAKTKAEIKKHIKENAPLFYRTVTALKPDNEKDFIETIGYLNVRGELQAKTFGPHTLVDYGFTFRKDLKTNQLYLVGFDHKTEWLINTKPKGSTIAAIEKIAKSKSTVIKKAVKSTAEEALESGAKAEEDKENVAAKAEVTTTKTKKKTKEAKPVTTKPVAETVEAAKPVATKKKKTKEAKPTTETVEAVKPVATKKKKQKTTDSEQLSMFDLNLDDIVDVDYKEAVLSSNTDYETYLGKTRAKYPLPKLTYENARPISRNLGLRILTEKERFRLMGVKDEDFEKLLSPLLTSKNLVHLAGDSIVTNVLMNVFDKLYKDNILTKPVRLIEFFAGYGSQALALKYLNRDFEHWKITEWAANSIIAYDLMHNDTSKDLSKGLSIEEIKDFLQSKSVSFNYKAPAGQKALNIKSEEYLRALYNAIIRTKNTVDISKTTATDLDVKDTDKYDYVLTYSFPCQALSTSGKREGMVQGSGSTSSLVWEVGRILTELKEKGTLPKVLVLENVKQLANSKNMPQFKKWIKALKKLGYKTSYKLTNATDYGVPQNRERIIAVSVLNENKAFEFAEPEKKDVNLQDILDTNADKSYYLENLSESALNTILGYNDYNINNPRWKKFYVNRKTAKTLTTKGGPKDTLRFNFENIVSTKTKESFNAYKYYYYDNKNEADKMLLKSEDITDIDPDNLNLDLNIDLTSKKNRDDLAKATYDFMHEKGTPALVTADNTPIVMFRGAEENEFENLGENKIYDNTGYRTKFNEFYTNSYTLADMYNKSTFKERSSNVKKIQGYVFNYTKDEILPLDVKGGSWHLIQLFRFERKYTDILDTYRRGLIGKRDIPEGALTIFKLTDGYNRIMDIKKRFSPKYETDFTAFEPTYNDVLYDYITQNSFDKQSHYDDFDDEYTYDKIMKLYADGIVSFNDISHNGVKMTKEDFSKLRNIVFERINKIIDYIDDLHKNIGLSKLQIAKIMFSIIPSGYENSVKYVHFETLEDENRDIYGFSTNDTAIIAALSGYKAIVIKNVEDLPKRVTEVTNDEETKFAGVSLYRLNTVFINLESNRQLKVTKSKKSAVNNFTYLDETINSYLLDLSQKELLEYYSIIAKRKDINHTTKYNSKSSIVTSTPKTKNLFAKEREYTLYDYVSKYIYRAAEDVYNGRLTSNLAKKLNKGLKSNYGISLLDSYFVTPEGDSLLKTHRFKEKGVDNKVSMYDNALENNEILIQASNNLVGVNNVATDDGRLTNTQLLDKEEIEEAFEVYIENFKNSLSSIKDLLNNDGIFDTNEKENIIKDLDKIVDNKINYDINYVLLNDKNISKNIKHLFDKLRRLRIELDANNNYRPIDYYKIIPSMYDKYLNPILNNYVSALKLLVPNNRTETRKLLNRINYYLSLLHLSYESKDILSDLSNNSRDRHTYEYTNFDEIFVPKKKNKGPGSKPSAKGKQYVGEKNRLDTRATGNFGITKKRKNTEGYLTTKKLKGGVEKTYAVPSRHYVNTADVEKYPHMKAYRGMLIDESVYDMLKNVDYDKLGNKLKAHIDSATLNIQSVIQFVRETAKMNNYEFELLVKYFFNNNAALLRIANIARKKYDTEEAYYKDTKVLDIVREKLLKNASDIAAMAYMLTNGGVNTSLFIAAGGTRSKKGKTNTQLSELEKALLKLRLEDLREIKIADILTPKGELDDKKFKALSKSLVDKGMSEKKANEVIFKYKDITLGELIDSNVVYDKTALSLTEMGILYNLLSSNPSFAMLLKGATNKIRRNTGEDYQYDTEVDYTSLQLLAFKMYDGTINSIREFYNYATSIQHLIDTSSEEATDAEGKTIKREGGVSNFYLPKAIIDFDKVTEEEKEEQKEILTLDEEDKKLLFLFKKVIHKEHIDNTEGAYIAKFIRKEKLNEILTDKYNEFGVNQADGMSYGETETELLTREAVSDTEKWLKSNLTSVGNIKKYFVEYMKKSVTYEKAKARKLAKEGKIELRSKSGVENKKERNRLISQIDKRLYRFVNILNSFESKKAYERLVASYPELKEYIVPVNDAQNQFGVKRKFSTVLTIEELVSLDKLTSKVFSSWSTANTNMIKNKFKNTEKKGSEHKKAFEEKINTEGQSSEGKRDKKSSEPTGAIIIEHKYNYKSFDDFADSDDNIPNLVKQLLATRYKTNRKTEVKGFDNNETVEVLNGKHFFSENRDALGNADQHEIIEAMNWFLNNQKYNTIGFVDPEDSRRFITHMFYFAEYVLYAHKKGIITLTKDMLDDINDWLRPYISASGTIMSIHSQFAEKIDPFREFVQDLEIDGIPLSEAEENEMYLALESNNFEKIMEVRTKIVNRIAAEKGDKKPLTRTIAAYRSMAMLSSPMTWLRNFVSNYALKYLNKLADRIGKILFKNKHEESQINLDIKPTKEVLEYIQKMFIDTKFFDTILSNLNKYSLSEMNVNRTVKRTAEGKITREEIMLNLILKSMYGEYYNQHAFNNKIANQLHGLLMKMLSDDKFVRAAALEYFAKILTARQYNLDTNEISDSVMNDFAISVGQALRDYMHSDNVFNKVEKYISERTELGWFAYKMIMPFASASWEWFKAALRVSPLGLAKAIFDISRLTDSKTGRKGLVTINKEKWLSGSTNLPPELTEHIVRRNLGLGTIGTVAYIFGAILAAVGIIGLEDDDYGTPKLRVFDLEVDVSSIFGTSPLLAGAALITAFNNEDGFTFENLIEGLNRTSDVIVDGLPLMTLIEFDMYQNGTWSSIWSYLENTATSFIPNILAWVGNLTYSGTFKTTNVFERAAVKVPFLNTAMDVFGWIRKKTDPYTGESGSYLDNINRFVPYISIVTRSNQELMSRANGLTRSELNGHYVINDEKFDVTGKELEIVNSYYGKWNAKDLAKFYNNQMKVTVKSNNKYYTLSYNQMTSEQRKKAISTIMSNNAELAKILAWIRAGHKYSGSETIYSKLRARGITTNISKGTKGYVK